MFATLRNLALLFRIGSYRINERVYPFLCQVNMRTVQIGP